MPTRRKGAVRKGHGVMCNSCGLDCGKGGARAKHVETIHDIDYDTYDWLFYDSAKKIIFNGWDASGKTKAGETAMTHMLIRRIIGNPGPRGVPRAARPPW
jgi:hypothetical protein